MGERIFSCGMGGVYYIPNLKKFIGSMSPSERALISTDNENLIVLDSDEDKANLIKTVREVEFIKDKEIVDYLELNFDSFRNRISKIPIDIDESRCLFRYVFEELPDSVFEAPDIITILKNVLNFSLGKNEINFIVMHVGNGQLLYNTGFRNYKGIYPFYFSIMKLNHDLATFFGWYFNSQVILETLYIKYILYANEKISKEDLELIRQTMNGIGKNLADFRFVLHKYLKEIRSKR